MITTAYQQELTPCWPQPAHLNYIYNLDCTITANLSNPCAETLTIQELLTLSGHSIAELPLHYSSLLGDEQLRVLISQLPEYQSSAINADNIVIFAGAQEALFASYQTLLQPKDEVILLTPSYPTLRLSVERLGAKVIPIELAYEQQWQPSLKDFTQAITERTKLIVINSPHNPTGSILKPELIQAIQVLAEERGIWLLFDDVFIGTLSTTELTNYRLPLTLRQLSVGVLSKSYGLAGLRIGWAVTKNEAVKKRLLAIKSYGSICQSIIDEQLAIAALSQSEYLLNRNRQIIQHNLQQLAELIQQQPLCRAALPHTGLTTTLLFDIPQPLHQLTQEFTQTTGILLLPVDLFGSEINGVRIGIGQKQLTQHLAVLGDYLNQIN